MDLTVLKEKRIPLTIEYGDESIKVEIKPHTITPAYRARFQKENAENTLADVMTRSVADVVASWDISIAGEPFPVSPENVKELPEGLVVAIWTEIDNYLGKLLPATPNE